MEDADAALARQCDCQACLADSIHRGRDDRDVELDIPGQEGGQVRFSRKDFTIAGDYHYIVES